MGCVVARLFGDNKPLSFPVVSAFLRLGHKYDIPDLQGCATNRLKACFPENLKDFRNKFTLPAKKYSEEGDLWFDPPLLRKNHEEVLGVIVLARAYDLPSLLPSAFYLASLLPYYLRTGDAQDQDGNLLLLHKDDLAASFIGSTILMQDEIIEVAGMMEGINAMCAAPACKGAFCRTSMNWANLVRRAGGCLKDTSWLDEYKGEICTDCRIELGEVWSMFREAIWSELPQTFHLVKAVE